MSSDVPGNSVKTKHAVRIQRRLSSSSSTHPGGQVAEKASDISSNGDLGLSGRIGMAEFSGIAEPEIHLSIWTSIGN
jgi:hypothetical protein